MSLKNFHVLFVTLAILLALLCTAQAVQGFRDSGSPLLGLAAAGALAGALALVGFEARFLRRCRKSGI